jgi:hypothetical protein
MLVRYVCADIGGPTVVVEKQGPMQCGESLEGTSRRYVYTIKLHDYCTMVAVSSS